MVSPIRTRLIQSVADAQTNPDPQPAERVPFIVASGRALAVGEQLLEEAASLGAVRSMISPSQVEHGPHGVRLEVPDPSVLREDARELTYALGALLYAWVTGQAPPRRHSMPMAHERALRKALAANGVDGASAELVRKLMGWDTTRRPWPEAALVLLRAASQVEDAAEESPAQEEARSIEPEIALAPEVEDAQPIEDAQEPPTELAPEPPTELAPEPPTELAPEPPAAQAEEPPPLPPSPVLPGPVLPGPAALDPGLTGPVPTHPDLYSVAYDQEILFFPEPGAAGQAPAGDAPAGDAMDPGYFPAASSDAMEQGFQIPDQTRVVNFPRLFSGAPAEEAEDEITDSEGFSPAGEDENTDPEAARAPLGLNMDETNPSSFTAPLGLADPLSPVHDEPSNTETAADDVLEPMPAPSQIRLEAAENAPAAARRAPMHAARANPQRGLGRWAGLILVLVVVAMGIALAARY